MSNEAPPPISVCTVALCLFILVCLYYPNIKKRALAQANLNEATYLTSDESACAYADIFGILLDMSVCTLYLWSHRRLCIFPPFDNVAYRQMALLKLTRLRCAQMLCSHPVSPPALFNKQIYWYIMTVGKNNNICSFLCIAICNCRHLGILKTGWFHGKQHDKCDVYHETTS